MPISYQYLPNTIVNNRLLYFIIRKIRLDSWKSFFSTTPSHTQQATNSHLRDTDGAGAVSIDAIEDLPQALTPASHAAADGAADGKNSKSWEHPLPHRKAELREQQIVILKWHGPWKMMIYDDLNVTPFSTHLRCPSHRHLPRMFTVAAKKS